MGNKVLAIHFFVLVLVWPILLPAGIDTGIGNAFLSPTIFNTFQQYFFKNSNITNFPTYRKVSAAHAEDLC